MMVPAILSVMPGLVRSWNALRWLAATVALALAAVLLSCGGSENGSKTSPPARPDRSDAGVIRAWADTLRRGEVARAAAYFTLPTLVQNGTPPLALYTRAQVKEFNRALPCGARLLRTYRSGRYTTAVFQLTERPGPGSCGPGTGQTALTKFLIRNGKIREWRRVADEHAPSAPSAPVV
jgi:hypothetical protein